MKALRVPVTIVITFRTKVINLVCRQVKTVAPTISGTSFQPVNGRENRDVVPTLTPRQTNLLPNANTTEHLKRTSKLTNVSMPNVITRLTDTRDATRAKNNKVILQMRNGNRRIRVIIAKVTIVERLNTKSQQVNRRRTFRAKVARVLTNLLPCPTRNHMSHLISTIGRTIIIVFRPKTMRVNFGAAILRLFRHHSRLVLVIRPRNRRLKINVKVNLVRIRGRIIRTIYRTFFRTGLTRILFRRTINICRRSITVLVVLRRLVIRVVRIMRIRNIVRRVSLVTNKVRTNFGARLLFRRIMRLIIIVSIGNANRGPIAIIRNLRVKRRTNDLFTNILISENRIRHYKHAILAKISGLVNQRHRRKGTRTTSCRHRHRGPNGNKFRRAFRNIIPPSLLCTTTFHPPRRRGDRHHRQRNRRRPPNNASTTLNNDAHHRDRIVANRATNGRRTIIGRRFCRLRTTNVLTRRRTLNVNTKISRALRNIINRSTTWSLRATNLIIRLRVGNTITTLLRHRRLTVLLSRTRLMSVILYKIRYRPIIARRLKRNVQVEHTRRLRIISHVVSDRIVMIGANRNGDMTVNTINVNVFQRRFRLVHQRITVSARLISATSTMTRAIHENKANSSGDRVTTLLQYVRRHASATLNRVNNQVRLRHALKHRVDLFTTNNVRPINNVGRNVWVLPRVMIDTTRRMVTTLTNANRRSLVRHHHATRMRRRRAPEDLKASMMTVEETKRAAVNRPVNGNTTNNSITVNRILSKVQRNRLTWMTIIINIMTIKGLRLKRMMIRQLLTRSGVRVNDKFNAMSTMSARLTRLSDTIPNLIRNCLGNGVANNTNLNGCTRTNDLTLRIHHR